MTFFELSMPCTSEAEIVRPAGAFAAQSTLSYSTSLSYAFNSHKH